MAFIPYISFPGTCEEALRFYADVFGGTVERLMRYADMPPGGGEVPRGMADRVMNATLRVGDAVLMASDSPPLGFEPPRGTSLYKGYPDPARARQVFARLARGGDVTMAFQPTFWSRGFGTCRDRFGTQWMIGVDDPPSGSA